MTPTSGKISPVKAAEGAHAPNSIKGALQKIGLNRMPGTLKRYAPFKELDGTYRTGIDPNANYILQMPEAEREQEKAKVNSYLEKAQELYGPNINLGPRSTFWTQAAKKYGDDDVAPFAFLKDGDNIYHFNSPRDFITYCYLRVHPKIAPSGNSLFDARYSRCEYYVNDYDVEIAVAYAAKTKIAKANKKLDSLSESKQRMIARQLGLAVSDIGGKEALYVSISDYIEESRNKKTSTNVDTFMALVDMKDDNLKVRDIVHQAQQYGIIVKTKGVIYRGQDMVATTIDEYVNFLSELKNQDILIALETELSLKREVKLNR